MLNELSNFIDLQAVHTSNSFLHGAAPSATDGEILLFLVRVRHIKNAQTR